MATVPKVTEKNTAGCRFVQIEHPTLSMSLLADQDESHEAAITREIAARLARIDRDNARIRVLRAAAFQLPI
jgi:hypothetical protein